MASLNLTEEEDREFWSLMKDPTVSEVKLNRVIRKMQAHDELSNSSSEMYSNNNRGPSLNGSDCDGLSPRERRLHATEDVDYTVTSLGNFLPKKINSRSKCETGRDPCFQAVSWTCSSRRWS